MPRSARHTRRTALALAVLLFAVAACGPQMAQVPGRLPAAAGIVAIASAPAQSAAPSALPPQGPTDTPTASQPPTATSTPTDTPLPTPFATDGPTATATSEPTPLPLPTPDGVCRTLRVPILMYHYVSAAPADAGSVRSDLSLAPERFEEQLAWLAASGYRAISLEDLTLALQAGTPLPERPVILTFDDGYADNYSVAFPLLKEYGFSATFFVVTAYLDENRSEYLTWDQVIEMHAAGMDIGSHSYTHPDLRGQTVDYLVWQMLGSKEAIEARTGEPVRFFCYPVGLYDDQAIEVARSLQFWGAVVTAQGVDHSNGELYTLRRVRVHGSYGARELADAIAYLGNVSEGGAPCTMTP